MSRITLFVIGIIAVIILAEIILYRVVRRTRSRKMAKIYVDAVKSGYKALGITGVLESVAGQLPPRSIESNRVKAACGYLRTSILKDYKTAFEIVEQGFFDKKVHAANQKMLEAEQKKISIPALLPEHAAPGASCRRAPAAGPRGTGF